MNTLDTLIVIAFITKTRLFLKHAGTALCICMALVSGHVAMLVGMTSFVNKQNQFALYSL